MAKKRPDQLHGYVQLSKEKIERRMEDVSVTDHELAEAAGVNIRTIRAILAGGQCQASTADRMAQALGLSGYRELLPDKRINKASGDGQPKPRTVGEWTVVRTLTRWLDTSNQLQYEISRMERRLIKNSFGRGKCYNLRYMPNDKRAEAEKQLVRHPTVCDRIGRHPTFPINKFADYHEVDKDYFWIIDEWEQGSTLSEAVEQKPLEAKKLPRLMHEIAEALQALHSKKIVRRELTPDFIVIRNSDGSVLLTDLELARLLDGSPTVSGNWEENPYLAPEVRKGNATKQADLFSWGQILYLAATGKEPDKLPSAGQFDALDLPDAVKEIASHCVSHGPSMRPKKIENVLKAIKGWQ